MKNCNKCWKTKEDSEFPIDPRLKSGRRSHCKECVAGYKKEYRKNNEVVDRERQYYQNNKDAVCARVKEYQQNNPEKAVAHSKISNGLKLGKIIKPSRCENCKEEKALDAHHHLGYAPENWYNVRWLCRACHAEAEKSFQPVKVKRAAEDGSFNPLFNW